MAKDVPKIFHIGQVTPELLGSAEELPKRAIARDQADATSP